MDINWYAVRTKSRHEDKVCYWLEKKNFHVFLPKVEVWSKRKDRKKKFHRPLFPGYLFVKCEMSGESWLSIVKISGVAGILGFIDGKPTPIPYEQIETVQKIINSGFTPRLHPYLNQGDKVIVNEGALLGATGFFLKVDHKNGKLIVSVDILGRSIEVDIEIHMVDKF